MNVLPFLPEFHEKVRDGRKTATARSKPYGKPGDKLQGPGVVLVLEHVSKTMLYEVAADCYGFEGLTSPDEFKAVWNRIHPRKPFEGRTEVFLHRFHVEGRLPVCDMGWKLLTLEERKAANRRCLNGWRPVWNDDAAAINRSKGCPAHRFRNLSIAPAVSVNGITDPAMLVCVACMEDGATPGGTWTEEIAAPTVEATP